MPHDPTSAALTDPLGGLPVFPLRGKIPAIPGGTGFLDATDDPIQISDWAMRFPGCNWGLEPGRAGLFVVDVDCKADAPGYESYAAELLGRHAPTLTVVTPSGGRHLVFRLPEGLDCLPTSCTGVFPGIDVRCASGYVVLPTPGSSYTLEAGGAAEPATISAALVQRIMGARAERRQRDPRLQHADRLDIDLAMIAMDAIPPVPGGRGERDRWRNVMMALCNATQGHAAAYEKFMRWSLAADRAGDPHDLDKQWQSVLGDRYAGLGGDALISYAERFGGEAGALAGAAIRRERVRRQAAAMAATLEGVAARHQEAAPPAPATPETASPTPPPAPRSWAALRARQDGKMRYMFKNLIDGPGLSMIYGPSNVGKSFLAVDMAWRMMTADPDAAPADRHMWAGRHRVAPGAVLYVAAEGGGGLPQRIEALARDATPAELERLSRAHTARPADLTTAEGVQSLSEDILTLRAETGLAPDAPVWVIIDTLAASLAGRLDENSATDMAGFLRRLRDLTERPEIFGLLQMTLIHHTGKSSTQPRGSYALYADMDTILELRRNGDDPGLIEIIAEKQRGMQVADTNLFFRVKPVLLGEDVEGDPITSARIEHIDQADLPAAEDRERRREVRAATNAAAADVDRVALEAFEAEAADMGGAEARVPKAAWRSRLSAMLAESLYAGADGGALRTAASRAVARLSDPRSKEAVLATDGALVWRPTPRSEAMATVVELAARIPK